MTLPAVYFVPHQDDETLSMSVDIIRHVAAGRETHIVLFTDGGDTGARYVINGYNENTGQPVTSNWWGSRHDPAVEGYTPLTWNDVYDARDKEFKSALGQLGIPPSNIHIVRTTNRTVAGFKATFMQFINQFPAGTAYKTMSPVDTHEEHRRGAQALWELWRDGFVSDVRFWLSRLDIMNGSTQGQLTAATTTAEYKKIEQATRAYRAWNPAAGSFAIGYHSVASQFEALLADPKFRYFKPEAFSNADLPF